MRDALYFDKWAFKAAMAQAKLGTHQELADKAGVSVDAIRRMSAGMRPGQRSRAAIVAALGVAEDTLWRRVE